VTRVLALDYGAARCGSAVSDPTRTVAIPLRTVERPESPAGMESLAELVDETDAGLVVVGLPLTLQGEEGEQAAAARSFAGRLRAAVDVPVELYDERLTTRSAVRTGGNADEDSRAAAHLLEGWLRSTPGSGA